MKQTARHCLIIVTVAIAISGCSSLKKLTGQSNDTVLPGTREDILTADQQTAQDPKITGQKQADPSATAPVDQQCDPNDPTCVSSIDQESQ